jgi:L1 cell adhesion molecule like protein
MTILGIDFGTTNTCVSYYKNDKVNIVQNRDGLFTTPSCLYFDIHSSNILYGNAAYNLLESNYNKNYISNIVHNFKRLLGITYAQYTNSQLLQTFFKNKQTNVIKDPDSDFCCIQLIYNNKQTTFTIIEIVSIFLKFIKTETKHYIGDVNVGDIDVDVDVGDVDVGKPQDIVITIPAYFSDIQRQHLQHSCNLAGLNILRIINEPTSAALAYAYNICKNKNDCDTCDKKNEYVLVIDCGGGTTDFSLLYMDYDDMLFEVINVNGNNFMGGEDLTNNLVNTVLSKLNLTIDTLTTRQLNIIKKECERAKCMLSFKKNVVMIFENLIIDKDISLNYSHLQFYNDNIVFFNTIKQYIIETIKDYDIDKIIFVGGTTRIPRFKQLCQKLFHNNIELCDTLDPDHTVSIGATLQGQLITDNLDDQSFNETLILDVVPISLGIETENGIMAHIVSKNTPLPVTKTQLFTNTEDNVNFIQIDIYQGERKFVKNNTLLSSFKIDVKNEHNHNFKRGEMKIKVTFDINKNGIVTVEATILNKHSNNSVHVHKINDITIKPILINNNEDDDTFIKIQDTKEINLLQAKMELYNSYQYLLDVFNTKSIDKNVQVVDLFNKTNEIITNYKNYSLKELRDYKVHFETKWHELMFL